MSVDSITKKELSSYITESQLSSPRSPATPAEVDEAIHDVLAERPPTKRWHGAIRRLKAMLFGVSGCSSKTIHKEAGTGLQCEVKCVGPCDHDSNGRAKGKNWHAFLMPEQTMAKARSKGRRFKK